MVSKAKIAANARYNVKKYDVVSFRVSKDESINQRIDEAITAINATIPRKEDQISKAAFILDAIRAKLDNPQPPTTTAPDVLQVPLSPDMVHNMDGAIRCGYAANREQYAIRAINTQLHADIATEKEKRRARPVYPPDDYFDE